MYNLTSKKCEACRIDAPLVTQNEIDNFMPQIPNWQIIEIDDINRLRRTFTFSNFTDALLFTNQVGAIAEEEDHHPALLTEWGKVTVTWWSHKIKGLHINDFIMAARTDKLV